MAELNPVSKVLKLYIPDMEPIPLAVVLAEPIPWAVKAESRPLAVKAEPLQLAMALKLESLVEVLKNNFLTVSSEVALTKLMA